MKGEKINIVMMLIMLGIVIMYFCYPIKQSYANELVSGDKSEESPVAIMASGTFYINGTVQLDEWYVLPETELSTLFPGPYKFEYLDAEEKNLYQISFDVSFMLEGVKLEEAPFVLTIPYISRTAKIAIKLNDVVKAEKFFSPNRPKVTVISPNGGEIFSKKITIRWAGSDADNDKLVYLLSISSDNGVTWDPLFVKSTETSYTGDISLFPSGEKYMIRVTATDGINTTRDLSDSSFTIK
jgi:hypothetical protein